jgi:hypothetical protein
MELFICIAKKLCPRGDLPAYDTSRDLALGAVNASDAAAGYFLRADTRVLPFATGHGVAATMPRLRSQSPRGCVGFGQRGMCWGRRMQVDRG